MFSILSRRCPLLATSCPSFFCLLSMLISDSRFDLVWFRLSCDHGWIRSGSVNVRKQHTYIFLPRFSDLFLRYNSTVLQSSDHYRYWRTTRSAELVLPRARHVHITRKRSIPTKICTLYYNFHTVFRETWCERHRRRNKDKTSCASEVRNAYSCTYHDFSLTSLF